MGNNQTCPEDCKTCRCCFFVFNPWVIIKYHSSFVSTSNILFEVHPYIFHTIFPFSIPFSTSPNQNGAPCWDIPRYQHLCSQMLKGMDQIPYRFPFGKYRDLLDLWNLWMILDHIPYHFFEDRSITDFFHDAFSFDLDFLGKHDVCLLFCCLNQLLKEKQWVDLLLKLVGTCKVVHKCANSIATFCQLDSVLSCNFSLSFLTSWSVKTICETSSLPELPYSAARGCR